MKKILRLCLVPLMALMSSSNLFAMETQPITQESEGLTANSVTYNVSFSNYKLTPKEYAFIRTRIKNTIEKEDIHYL